MEDKCSFLGCDEENSFRFYEFKPLCSRHYFKIIEEDFFVLFNEWEEATKPPARLTYLLGRLYDELDYTDNGGYLSAARIRDRGFNFIKDCNCIKFAITRHLNAWTGGVPMERVVQLWKLNVKEKTAEMIGTRDWEKGDPE